MKPGLLFVAVVAFAASSAQGVGAQTAMPPATMLERPETRCVVQAAGFHQVNPWILRSILSVESNFNPAAVNINANGSKDVGMGQMNSIHFRELADNGIAPSDLMDACVATYVAGWHLAKQIKRYGNTWFGIAAYHSASPCFNERYQGLIWNQLVRWNVVAGPAIKVKTLAQCGYVAPARQAKNTRRHDAVGQGTALAFDD